MKLTSILLLILFLFEFSYESKSFNCYNANCPDPEPINILIIHSILTSPDFTEIRDSININHYEALSDKINTLNMSELKEMWQEWNIEAVNDEQTCKQISNKLKNSENYKIYNKNYNPYYYKIEDKYMVLYNIKNKRKAVGSNVIPIVFLTKDFNVNGEFTIK